MLKIAMLSKWHVHAAGYAREFNQTGKSKVVAVWDEEEARGKEWAGELGVPFYSSLDEILASDIDAVCVTTPTTMHREVILKAAKAGKCIFTEKALELGQPAQIQIILLQFRRCRVQHLHPHDFGDFIRVGQMYRNDSFIKFMYKKG